MNTHGSHWIRRAKRLAIYRRDNMLCAYCQHSVTTDTTNRADLATLDHIIPRSKGGTNSERNLVTAHVRCNSSRGDKDLPVSLCDLFLKMASKPLELRAQ